MLEQYVYVVATNRPEAEALAAKGDTNVCLKRYGDAMRILKEINTQPHPGTRYAVFAVRSYQPLDGK